jgi:pyruvyltransferase
MDHVSLTGSVDADIKGISVVHWNPSRTDTGGVMRPVDNFGDLIGPRIVAGMLERLGINTKAPARRRLLSVGSILHFAHPGDVVWGSGINGKQHRASTTLPPLDVRAVRGPGTRLRLLAQGAEVPAVFGDPALLLPLVMPELLDIARAEPVRDVTIVPNLNDFDPGDDDPRILDPRGSLDEVLAAIAASRLVVGSSLHGIIVAEALGRLGRVVRSDNEHYFKYFDYYAGTGRFGVQIAADVDEAIALGGAEPGVYDLEALAAAFPVDLWVAGEPAPRPPSLVQMPAAWFLAAGECWAARQVGAPLKDEHRRLRSEVLAGFLADAESLGDIELSRGMELVAGAAEGVDLSELSARDRSAATLVAAGDASRLRVLSRVRNRGRTAIVDAVRSDPHAVALRGRVVLDSLEIPDVCFTITDEESGAVDTMPLRELEGPGDGEWRWQHTVPFAALQGSGRRFFGVALGTSEGEPEHHKLRYAPGATNLQTVTPAEGAMSIAEAGGLVFADIR